MSSGLMERCEERLKELRGEFANGQEQLRNLEERRSQLQETLLRISGAIQMLTEMIEEERGRKES